MLPMSPRSFVNNLKERGINRCYWVLDISSGSVTCSHPDELAGAGSIFVKEDRDYNGHEGVFLQLGKRTNTLLGAFIWRSNRGQACGGIRLWDYDCMEEYLRDGLRLAQGMGLKSALAGLWSGGGKGVIQMPDGGKEKDPSFRTDMFHDYGEFLSSLNGCYVAAEDVGLNVNDLDDVHTFTRYTTCISESKGGSGNPSTATGKGVICAMEGALDYLDMGTLAGKSIAIQGAGNVATVIVEGLLQRNVGRILVTDCNQDRIDAMRVKFSQNLDKLILEKVDVGDNSILSAPCDVLSPCALGNILNPTTIPGIKAKIVCGAANNQLGCPADSQLLSDHGIVYVVDFLANRMGIVNCANETYGRLTNDSAIERHFGRDWENSVFCMTKATLEKADKDGITTHEAANQIADKLSLKLHPVWPRRGQEIISSLVKEQWHLQSI
ncbi:Glutamate dehydrogenase 1, mitochondrial [Holothuria leucospilota]|uniref:Glutamate dehydrogenase 1, mitochondrial n=1 Tax=Holothuria leucospilota TaxID=206669 RepID=A0A9Q1CK94_HOLLE|nr:Glutamate dehydrogenase 1, mitochondrial [Holothuria leucospilota]